MAKRRPSGDGMVRKREDGRWEGRIVVGHKDNGDSIFRYVYADTQKELTARLRKCITAYQGVDLTDQSKLTLSEWLDQWLVSKEGMVRPGTLNGYRGYIESHIRPCLGEKRIGQLKAADIQRFYDILSRESMQKLLIQAKEEKYYELFLLEFATGLRLGELTALQWEDLNLTTGELRISKQAVVIGSELVIIEPKTKAAVRTLLLPPKVLEVFREYRKRNVSRWLFPSPKKEDLPLLPSVVRQRLHRLLDHAGCERVRFHDLRHPYVKHTTKIFSLRLMNFQAQAYPDARQKTRGACQLLRVGQSRSPVRPLCNRKRFSCLPPQSKMSWILYAISMRLSGYTSTRSISSSASSVVSVSASKIALDASLRLSCRACSSCFCFACANTAA